MCWLDWSCCKMIQKSCHHQNSCLHFMHLNHYVNISVRNLFKNLLQLLMKNKNVKKPPLRIIRKVFYVTIQLLQGLIQSVRETWSQIEKQVNNSLTSFSNSRWCSGLANYLSIWKKTLKKQTTDSSCTGSSKLILDPELLFIKNLELILSCNNLAMIAGALGSVFRNGNHESVGCAGSIPRQVGKKDRKSEGERGVSVEIELTLDGGGWCF